MNNLPLSQWLIIAFMLAVPVSFLIWVGIRRLREIKICNDPPQPKVIAIIDIPEDYDFLDNEIDESIVESEISQSFLDIQKA